MSIEKILSVLIVSLVSTQAFAVGLVERSVPGVGQSTAQKLYEATEVNTPDSALLIIRHATSKANGLAVRIAGAKWDRNTEVLEVRIANSASVLNVPYFWESNGESAITALERGESLSVAGCTKRVGQKTKYFDQKRSANTSRTCLIEEYDAKIKCSRGDSTPVLITKALDLNRYDIVDEIPETIHVVSEVPCSKPIY